MVCDGGGGDMDRSEKHLNLYLSISGKPYYLKYEGNDLFPPPAPWMPAGPLPGEGHQADVRPWTNRFISLGSGFLSWKTMRLFEMIPQIGLT